MTIDEVQVVADQMNKSIPEKYTEYCPWELGEPSFTGWKTSVPRQGVGWEENTRLLEAVKSSNKLDFVGQWLYAVTVDGPFFYVNLPGFQCGQYQKGECFDVGDERVYSDKSPEEIERLLKLGLKKLLLLVDLG